MDAGFHQQDRERQAVPSAARQRTTDTPDTH